MGGQVKVGHALGAGEQEQARGYARNAIQLSLLFRPFLWNYLPAVSRSVDRILPSEFQNRNPGCRSISRHHLRTGHSFPFLNQVFTGILTAMGNSRTSFLATAIGLVINIILDPILIFGIGPFPQMYVAGAAIATVFAQSVVTAVFLVSIRREPDIFHESAFFSPVPRRIF